MNSKWVQNFWVCHQPFRPKHRYLKMEAQYLWQLNRKEQSSTFMPFANHMWKLWSISWFFSVFFINLAHGNGANKWEQYFIPKLPYMGLVRTELSTNKLIDTKWRQSYFPLLSTHVAIWEIPCPVLSLHCKRGVDKLKDVQQKISKTVCKQMHMGCGMRLKERSLLSLEEKGLMQGTSWSLR